MPKQRTVSDRRRHERTLHLYDRRSRHIPPGRCILIVCEGAETEPNYFESLRDYLKLSTVQVKIKDRAGAPISVVEEAQSLLRRREHEIREGRLNMAQFEAVWCVFDVENPHQNQTFQRAVQSADKNHFHLAVSNPAFEFWYVLHFDRTTRPFANGDELKEYLKRHIAGYYPAMQVFATLVQSTSQAVKNAIHILKDHPQGAERFPNPSTQVHLLVQEMFQMSPSGREHFKSSWK